MAKKKRLSSIEVMGTTYQVDYRTEEEDPYLEEALGYCDKYLKLIVIDDDKYDLEDMIKKGGDQWKYSFDCLQKKVLRHELTHAFVTECGLSESSYLQWANNEELIDFLAINATKLVELYKKAGAL